MTITYTFIAMTPEQTAEYELLMKRIDAVIVESEHPSRDGLNIQYCEVIND